MFKRRRVKGAAARLGCALGREHVWHQKAEYLIGQRRLDVESAIALLIEAAGVQRCSGAHINDLYRKAQPPAPLPFPAWRQSVWQVLASANMVFGGWYISWRWQASINWDAWYVSLPLIIAETGSYIGLLLFTFNLWRQEDTPQSPPPRVSSDIGATPPDEDRPLTVDVFFPTYSEDPELVRLSLLDAKKLTYPHPIDIQIHVPDDGKREAMRAVAEQEGVGYLTRSSNIGFKAGNMRNGLEQTHGDLIVICDADTRPFPTLLQHTLGYFRDPQVAWVQTPQWFFDIPEGTRLPDVLSRRLQAPGRWFGKLAEALFGLEGVTGVFYGSEPRSAAHQVRFRPTPAPAFRRVYWDVGKRDTARGPKRAAN